MCCALPPGTGSKKKTKSEGRAPHFGRAMKNGCIALQAIGSGYSDQYVADLLAALRSGGYAVDKVSVLFSEEGFAEALEEYGAFDNVFVLAGAGSSAAALGERACAGLGVQPADGVRADAGDRTLFFLREEEACSYVKEKALAFLDEKYGCKHARIVVRCVGVPEDKFAAALGDVKRMGDETFSYNVGEKWGDLRLEIVYPAERQEVADKMLRSLVDALNDFIYAVDDLALNECVFEMLKLRGMQLALAESFTGGGVASRLIEMPGISSVLYEGVVAYANVSKIKRLGVNRFTVIKNGAVSDETAYEMAAGLIAGGYCNISLATTGIAGPQTDDSGKPVGLCYLAVGLRDSVYVYKYQFGGSREDITQRAINQSLFLMYKHIK